MSPPSSSPTLHGEAGGLWWAAGASSDEEAEIKRMYVAPAFRGRGVSVTVLKALEGFGRARGWSRLVLETGTEQPDALRFYEREGYARIPNFGDYAGSALSVCVAKPLR
jgi:putative acetyltransferase